jgi:hypothetical protein
MHRATQLLGSASSEIAFATEEVYLAPVLAAVLRPKTRQVYKPV